MSDVVDKVQKLLALAADAGASDEEARSAAVQAAKLIREHKLVLAAPRARAKAKVGDPFAAMFAGMSPQMQVILKAALISYGVNRGLREIFG